MSKSFRNIYKRTNPYIELSGCSQELGEVATESAPGKEMAKKADAVQSHHHLRQMKDRGVVSKAKPTCVQRDRGPFWDRNLDSCIGTNLQLFRVHRPGTPNLHCLPTGWVRWLLVGSTTEDHDSGIVGGSHLGTVQDGAIRQIHPEKLQKEEGSRILQSEIGQDVGDRVWSGFLWHVPIRSWPSGYRWEDG